jgi:hypothetical protein
MDWETIKNVTLLTGGIVGLLALIKGVVEYSRNNAMRRAEYFSQLHKQLHEVVVLSQICDYLDTDSPDLANLGYSKKYHFLSFFETVALMVNTGLLKKELAHYMFSYYAIRCYESKNFWNDIKKDSLYWTLFCSFACKMKQIEKDSIANTKKLRSLRF